MFFRSTSIPNGGRATLLGKVLCLLVGLAALALAAAPAGQPASATVAAPALPTWEQQSPWPTGATLYDVDMISATEGWAAGQYIGNGGVVVHTTDGGATWSYSTTNVEEPNYAVRFLDSLHGWASSNNAVFYTTDGGQTWGEGSGVIGSMYALEFATLNDGFTTSGNDHGYFRTTDGGHTWNIVRMARNVLSFQFFDANNGVANAVGGVYHTTDRGNTWTFTPGQGGSQFLNHSLGWAVFENVSQRTTDGGASWQTGSMPGEAWVYDVHFVDANNGWAAGAGFQILRTTDSGMTWTFSRQPNTYPHLVYDAWGIDFTDPAHGMAVGGFAGGALRAGGVIFSTSDAGATWLPRLNGSGTTTFRITALDALRAWAANDYSEVLWTVDGGARWNLSSVPKGGEMRDIEFASGGLNGWVVGYTSASGTVARSTNGGRTWTRQFPGTSRPMYGVDVINDLTAVVVGGGFGGPAAARTTDGGVTWTSFDAHNGSILFDVFFVNATTGWIVGNGGRISKSTDSGQTWLQQPSPVSAQLNQVSFADENNGWAVGGFSSVVLHTTDGGQTWVQQNAGLPPQAFVTGVSAVSPSVAWISTAGQAAPHVKRTTNGGATWEEDPTGTDPFNSWNSIYFVNADYGWVGGMVGEPRGGILRRVPEASTPTPTGTPGSPTSTPPATFTAVATQTPAPTCPPRVETGSITSSDEVALDVLEFDEIASKCNVPKGCPARFDASSHTDSYTYVNSTGSTRCITVVLDGTQCGPDIEAVFSAAYLGSFSPLNACFNYLADPGFYSDAFAEEATYSFNVPAGATFVVIVQEAGEKVGCQSYTLTVSGLDVCSTSTPTATAQVTSTPTAPSTATPVATAHPSSTSTPGGTTATATVVPGSRTATRTATTTPCSIQFSDVPESSAFYSYIRCLVCRDIASGYSDGTFRPSNLVTRGQLAKIVSNAAGFTEDPGDQVFEDVPDTNPFYPWINRLGRRGHMSGYDCGGPGEPCSTGRPYFRPFANATRAQTAKIVSNAATYDDPPAGQTFEDVPPTHPFYEWIQRLASRNVMSGYDCGSPGEPCSTGRPYFRPYNNVTRGQSSKIVANTFYSECGPATVR
jgi:photosystem II stability/assembly factor-like uncharacterized protein